MRADVVAWLRIELPSFNGSWIASQIERGDADGYIEKRAKEQTT
jgi:hypothetical protein